MARNSGLKEMGTGLLSRVSSSNALLNTGIVRQTAHQDHTGISTWKGARSKQVVSWRILSSGIQRRILWWKWTNVSEENFASVFMVEESAKQESNKKQCSKRCSPPKRRLNFVRIYSVIYQKTNLHRHKCENLKSNKASCFNICKNCNKIIFNNVLSNRPTFVKIYSITYLHLYFKIKTTSRTEFC